MNNRRSFKLTVLIIIVLLVAASVVTWRSAAALPVQDPPGGVVGPRDPARMAASAPEDPIPGGPGFQMVNPFQFRPAFPDVMWEYNNGELDNPGPDSGHNFYEAALSIPDDVTITKMVVYFYDNNTDADILVGLWRIDPSTGTWLTMAEVASSGAEDQYRHVEDTSIIEPAVDQQNYSYVVEVAIPPVFNTLRLAGVRIDYGHTTHLPVVTKNH